MKKRLLHGILYLVMTMMIGLPAFAQQPVKGTLRSSSGDPVSGASITVKRTGNGATADANGNFTVRAVAGDTLVISSIGYEVQEVRVTSAAMPVNVVLKTAVGTLNDVVVIGYGTRTKKDLTGSVATVSAKDFQQGAVTTPDQLVTGKVAGVVITPNGGAPGAGGTIRVRGGTSLSASNNPLIVVDGVPLTNDNVSGVSNPLSLINPNDIESFNILKDASATAIYGNRASNGVIIITTKSGAAGKLKLNFNSVLSQSVKRNEVKVLDANQYRAVVNAKGTDAEKAMLGTANTNWQDEIFQKAFGGDYNLNVSGGINKLPYRLSAGYTHQDGILRTSNIKRTSLGLNLTPSFFNNSLKANINLKGVYQKTRFANEGAIGAAIGFDPTQPVYVSNTFGNFYEWVNESGIPIELATKNPLGQLLLNSSLSDVYRSIGSIKLDYKLPFLPELTATLNAGYDVSKTEGSGFIPAYAALSYQRGGSSTQYSQRRKDKLLDFYLLYTKDLKEIESRMDVTAGYSYQDFFRGSPAYPNRNAAGAILSIPVADSSRNTLLSVFARLNYTFKGRYLLTASVRRDGTSRFSPDNRWGNFPSAALAWRIKEESFLKNNTLFSDLKLRAGFGITGNQEVGSYYPYLPIYTIGGSNVQYPMGDTSYSTYRAESYDPNIKWETTTAWNAGLDFGFLKNRITGTLDFYYKKTKDLLADIPAAAGANLSNHVLTNVGNIESKGIELAINATLIDKNAFNWKANFNISYNHNKILKLSNVSDSTSEGILTGSISGGKDNTVQINTVGYAPQTFYVYKQVYDADGNPVEGVYDKQKNGATFYRYKSANPKLTLGFTSQMSYRNWDMSFVLRSNIGNYVYNNVRSGGGAYNSISTGMGYIGNVNVDYLNTGFSNSQYFSDYYVENASFLRMDNLSVGYNFGKILRNTATLRVNAIVQNVFVVTKYTGIDPEVYSGIDNNVYPRPRIYSIGINLSY